MIRFFAPFLIDLNGNIHKYSVAEQISPGCAIRIYPFTEEIHSTIYIAPKIKIILSEDKQLCAQIL